MMPLVLMKFRYYNRSSTTRIHAPVETFGPFDQITECIATA